MKLITTPNEDHRFYHEEEDIAQNPKETAKRSREGSRVVTTFIYQIFRGLSCRFGISRDYHIFVCGSGCHKFDLVISFTAAAVQRSDMRWRRAKRRWREKDMNCGAPEDQGCSRRWWRRWRIPEWYQEPNPPPNKSHDLCPSLVSEFVCPHQVYIAVIKSLRINFIYTQLCAAFAITSCNPLHYNVVWF